MIRFEKCMGIICFLSFLHRSGTLPAEINYLSHVTISKHMYIDNGILPPLRLLGGTQGSLRAPSTPNGSYTKANAMPRTDLGDSDASVDASYPSRYLSQVLHLQLFTF